MRSYAGDDGPATEARLNQPSAITGDAAGKIYILDTGNRRIRKLSRDGRITSVPGGEQIVALQSSGLAVDANGNLLVSDTMRHRVPAQAD